MDVRRVNSYGKLRVVGLVWPTDISFEVPVGEAMFISEPDPDGVLLELAEYATLLWSLGVEIKWLTGSHHPNQIFLADMAFVVDDHIILSRPKHKVRQGEEKFLYIALREWGVSPSVIHLGTVESFEAADFLLTNSRIIVSVGGRTSVNAVVDLNKRKLLPRMMYVTSSLKEGIPQHLFGHKQIVSDTRLLSRTTLSSDTLGFGDIIAVPESEEVVDEFAMNIVVVDRNVIIMPDGCPETKALYEKHGLIVYTTPMSEIHKMGGGLACITLVLVRDGEVQPKRMTQWVTA